MGSINPSSGIYWLCPISARDIPALGVLVGGQASPNKLCGVVREFGIPKMPNGLSFFPTFIGRVRKYMEIPRAETNLRAETLQQPQSNLRNPTLMPIP